MPVRTLGGTHGTGLVRGRATHLPGSHRSRRRVPPGIFTAAREVFIDDDDLELFIAGIDHISTTLAGQAELVGDYGTDQTYLPNLRDGLLTLL